MSLVVLEAALHGLESIFTDQCGLDELNKRQLGTSVPVNVGLIAEAIKVFIKTNKVRKNNLQLKNYVSTNFNWERISNMYLKIISNS